MRDAIEAVMVMHPDLTVDGVNGVRRPNFETQRARLLDPLHVDEFRLALAWLSHVPKIKRGGESSYCLKHVAEDWAGSYIANGPFIAAAVHLSFRVEHHPWDRRHPNPIVGVAGARHWPVRPDTHSYDWIFRRYPAKRKVIIPPPTTQVMGC